MLIVKVRCIKRTDIGDLRVAVEILINGHDLHGIRYRLRGNDRAVTQEGIVGARYDLRTQQRHHLKVIADEALCRLVKSGLSVVGDRRLGYLLGSAPAAREQLGLGLSAILRKIGKIEVRLTGDLRVAVEIFVNDNNLQREFRTILNCRSNRSRRGQKLAQQRIVQFIPATT